MGKNNFYAFIAAILLFMSFGIGNSQTYPLQVTTRSPKGVSPMIGEIIENPNAYFTLKIASTVPGQGTNHRVYLKVHLQQVAPSTDISITPKQGWRPRNPIEVKPTGITSVRYEDLHDHFTGMTLSDFDISGVEDLDSYTSYTNATRLPEGVYNVCFVAYDFDAPMGSEIPLSDPEGGCATVTICYEAEEPRWILPYPIIDMDQEHDTNLYTWSVKKPIRFQWSKPLNSCGKKSDVVYDFKLVRLMEGQTDEDAIKNNPPILIQTDLKQTSFVIDSITYPELLEKGSEYVVRVSAKKSQTSDPGDYLEINNDGNSRILWFRYGTKEVVKKPTPPTDDYTDDKERFKGKPKPIADPTIKNCNNPLPADTVAIAELRVGDTVQMGKFTMYIESVDKDTNNTFKGKGSIKAELLGCSFLNWFFVKVDYTNLTVNSAHQALTGTAKGTHDESMLDLCSIFEGSDDTNPYAKKLLWGLKKAAEMGESKAKELTDYVSALRAAGGIAGMAQTLPINVKSDAAGLSGYHFDAGITDMLFTPLGASFSMVLMTKIPQYNNWLAFGINDICMYGPGFQNGKISLLADVEIPMGTDKVRLFIEGSGDSTTYVKWKDMKYDGMAISARLEFPSDVVRNLDDKTKPVYTQFAFECKDWSDWTAKINLPRFEIVDVPGYAFAVHSAIYDHSNKTDPAGFKEVVSNLKKKGYWEASETQEENSEDMFHGVFFEDVELSLPDWISDDKGDRVSLHMQNAFWDKQGFTADFSAFNPLSLETGNAGGWGFSIDTLSMTIAQSSFREGRMVGGFIVPLGADESSVRYSTVLTKKPKQGITYDFTVVPNARWKFLKYFEAELASTSQLQLKIDSGGVSMSANFDGSAGVQIPDPEFKVDLMKFKGLAISNRDENGKPGFQFRKGTWGFVWEDLTSKDNDDDSSFGTSKQGKSKESNNSKEETLKPTGPKNPRGGTLRPTGSKRPRRGRGPAQEDVAPIGDNGFVQDGKQYGIKLGPFEAYAEIPKFKFNTCTSGDCADSYKLPAQTLTIVFPLECRFKSTSSSEDKTMVGVRSVFSVHTDMTFNKKGVKGKEIPVPSFNNWGAKFHELSITGEFGPVKIYGSLEKYEEDVTFGKGFRGAVKCEFPLGIAAYATAQFGEVNNISYWYVDAGLNLGDVASLEVGGGTFAINGFGGGVWKNMKIVTDTGRFAMPKKDNLMCTKPDVKDGGEMSVESVKLDENGMPVRDKNMLDFEKDERFKELGGGLSGLKYKPVAENQSGWGFYAKLDYCASKVAGGTKTFYGSGTVSASFINNGLDLIHIRGDINAISTGKGSKSMVKADVTINYNHPDKIFDLKVGVKVDWGIGDANVPFDLHVNGKKKEFYFALGTPERFADGKCSGASTVCLSLFDVNAGDVFKGHCTAQAYVCGGNGIPFGLPTPPQKILDFLNLDANATQLGRYRKDPKKLGKGFMMGARIDMGFSFDFGPLYASLDAIAGFDVALLDQGYSKCSDGRTIKGFNGYYAMGQIYGYLHGDAGVQLKIFGSKKRFSLCSITAGALMQGGFKNPSWLKGKAKVKGSVLGGMIKFNTSIRFSLGTPCEVASDPLKDLKFVESITPGYETESEARRTENSASVFAIPKIACGVKMNQDFKLMDDNGRARYYQFQFESVSWTCISDGSKDNQLPQKVNEPVDMKDFNDERAGNEFILEARERLKPNSMYKITVVVRGKEFRYGYYRDPLDERGNPYVASQTEIFYFKTGPLPNYIDVSNIRGGYPVEDQFETFASYGEKGYLVLTYAQEYLFRGKGSKDMFGEFIDKTDRTRSPIRFSYQYKSSLSEAGGYPGLVYTFPGGLQKGHIYESRFYVRKTAEQAATYTKKNTSLTFKSHNRDMESSSASDFGVQDYTKGFETVSAKEQNRSDEQGYSETTSSATYTEKAKADQYSMKLNSKGSKAQLSKIFTSYFRVSEYTSLQDKFANVSITPILQNGKDGKRYVNRVNMSYRGYKNGRSVTNGDRKFETKSRYLQVVFPSYTTREELYAYRAWESGGNPNKSGKMFWLQLNNLPSSEGNVLHLWKTYCQPFMNLMAQGANRFHVPFTSEAHTSNISSSWFENYYSWIGSWIGDWSVKESELEGRLTATEKSTGRIYRSKYKRPEFWYSCNHAIAAASHFLYVINFADEIISENIDCDCNYGSYRISDDFSWANTGQAGHEFYVDYKTSKAASMFSRMNQGILDAYGTERMNKTIWKHWNGDFCQGNGGKKTDKEDPFLSWRENDELGAIYNECSVSRRSNTVYLRALWLRRKDQWVKNLYKNATIGNHKVAIKYYRTGVTKTLKERWLYVPTGF